MRRKERAKNKRNSYMIRCYFECLLQMSSFVSVTYGDRRTTLAFLKKEEDDELSFYYLKQVNFLNVMVCWFMWRAEAEGTLEIYF